MRRRWLVWVCGLLLVGVFGCAGGGGGSIGGMSAHKAFGADGVALIDAAARGDTVELQRLLGSGVDVNLRGFEGITPLMWVMVRGDQAAAARLLAYGADPNRRFDNGHSLMSLAAGGNSPKRLEFLLRHGGDPNLLGPQDDPLLSMAVLHQRDRHIDLLLQYGADINGHDPITKRTAANVAVGQARFDLAVRLLEAGLDYNLGGLVRSVENRALPPDSPQQKWRKQLISMLKERGYQVQLPK